MPHPPPPPPQPPPPLPLMPPSQEVEWQALPLELLYEIVKKLASVVEFVRFRAVCRTWRSAASPADLPPQLPWLILPYHPDSEARPFRCLSTGIVRVLRLPNSYNRRICGSGHGWLILFYDETTAVTLINPLTKSRISLPSSGIPGRMLVSATLSANPTSASGCTVALSAACTPTMAFCYLWPGGHSDWFKINMKLRYWGTSIAYHRGSLCATDGNQSLVIWDTTPHRPLTPADFSVNLPSLGEDWTVEHCQIVNTSEELLVVAFFGCFGNPARNCSVVYKLDSESKRLNQVVSKSLGDEVRLLYNDPLVQLSTGEYLACRECLYFAKCGEINDGDENVNVNVNVNVMVKVLDLKKGGMEELEFESAYLPGFARKVSWFVPGLI